MPWWVTADDRAQWNRIEQMLRALLVTEGAQMAAIDDLRAEVEQNADVTQSAIVLLNGLKAALDAAIASGDMTQVQELSNQLSNQTDSLAAAVAAIPPPA